MCGVPRGGGDGEVVGCSDTSKLRVSNSVIAEMLARVAAGVASNSSCHPEDVAEYAKKAVASLLEFKV